MGLESEPQELKKSWSEALYFFPWKSQGIFPIKGFASRTHTRSRLR